VFFINTFRLWPQKLTVGTYLCIITILKKYSDLAGGAEHSFEWVTVLGGVVWRVKYTQFERNDKLLLKKLRFWASSVSCNKL